MIDIQDLLQNVKLVDLLKSAGRIREYEKFKKVKTNNDLLDLSLNDLVGFCDLLGAELTELIEVGSLKVQSEINTIKKHIHVLKHQAELLQKPKSKKGNNIVLEDRTFSIPSEHEYIALGYNIGKLNTINRTKNALLQGISNQYAPIAPPTDSQIPAQSALTNTENEMRKTSPRAHVHDALQAHSDTPARIREIKIPENASTVGTSPRADVNRGYLQRLIANMDSSQNIATRADATERGNSASRDANATKNIPDATHRDENAATCEAIGKNSSAEVRNTPENAVTGNSIVNYGNSTVNCRELTETGGGFDQLSKLPEAFLESDNFGVYHNVEEANKIFARQRKLEKTYVDHPEKVAKVNVVSARNGVICYPTKYNRECVSILDAVIYEDSGEFNVYYSVFNKQGDFLFSEVYSCHYDNGENKEIKYYKKMFFDVITPGMVFKFSEDDEIARESFYYGIYRQYRSFGLPV